MVAEDEIMAGIRSEKKPRGTNIDRVDIQLVRSNDNAKDRGNYSCPRPFFSIPRARGGIYRKTE
jgi:hypothetical protein